MINDGNQFLTLGTQPADEYAVLLPGLVSHFREKRDELRRQWVRQMMSKGLLAGLTPDDMETESITIYDTCVGCLETGLYDGAQNYANTLAERGVLRGMTTEQIIGGMLRCAMFTGGVCSNGISRT